MKEEYERMCDRYWEIDNQVQLEALEEKKGNLSGWSQVLKAKKDKVQDFEEQRVLELNRVDSEDDLIESSHSHSPLYACPLKIEFN